MNRKNIEITISPDGEVDIEAVGFHGADCDQATAFLEAALGKISSKHRKPEYYRRARVRDHQKVRA